MLKKLKKSEGDLKSTEAKRKSDIPPRGGGVVTERIERQSKKLKLLKRKPKTPSARRRPPVFLLTSVA
jgi:hypothetical protein